MTTGRTEQGLAYAVKRSSSAVAYCAISVKCGTRDEKGFHPGIAHFVEHTIFKGTVNRKASQINGCLDRLGGDLNAFTTKEETVFHTTTLKADLPKAADLLMDLVTGSTFPQKAIQTEMGVVVDEIAQYKDSPADDVYDRFEEMLFEGHPLGGRILGTAASVKKMTSEELVEFRRSRFHASRMAFTVVADIEEEKMAELICRLSAKYFTGEVESPYERVTMAPQPRHFDKTVDKRNHEANGIIGGVAPSLYEEHDRLVCVLLCNIIGGPASNSMLNSALREKHGWVYGAECSYTQYADSGIVTISIGCDKENLEKCFAQTDRILEKMRTEPLSPAKLRAAKKQLLGQLLISSDNGETQALSMGKSMLSFGRIASDEENIKAIESITSEELRNMACRVFEPSAISRLVYL